MNLQYFFTCKDSLPPGVGFDRFGPEHLITLAIGISVVIMICLIYYRADQAARRRMDKIFGFGFFAAYYILYFGGKLILIGRLDPKEAPFHLCRIAGILCVMHSFRSYNWIEQVLYTMGLPGAVIALLFVDWNEHPAISYWTILTNIFHFGIILYIVLQLMSHKITPRLKYVWTVAVFIGIIIPPIYLYNKKFGTNFLFVNYPSPGSPLVLLEKKFGNPGYIIPYLIFVWVVILGMYLAGYLVSKYRSVKQ